ADTVVLPTPPLPATMTRRDAAKNCAGSTPRPLRQLPWGLLVAHLIHHRREITTRGFCWSSPPSRSPWHRCAARDAGHGVVGLRSLRRRGSGVRQPVRRLERV